MSTPTFVSIADMMAAPITEDDLDFELDSDAQNTMNDFEAAWKTFMKEHPDLVPEGKREHNIKQLQEQATLTTTKQTQVTDELQKQLDFFEMSRKGLEQDCEKEIESTRATQKEIHAILQQKQDDIGIAEHLQSQTIPFDHFLVCLDRASRKAKTRGTLPTLSCASGEKDKKVTPSDRAMFLVNTASVDESDVELKAYQIDHALLNARVEMLRKEAEGYEKLLESQKMVGKFLDENNVWTMVSKPVGLEVV